MDTKAVYIHRCSNCGLELFGFSRAKPVPTCPQCDYGFSPVCEIRDPHPDTVAQAEREEAARI